MNTPLTLESLLASLKDPQFVHANMLAGHIAKIDMSVCAHTHGQETIAAWNTRANTPDSAAQGAMGDELNVVWLTGILERLDEHRLTGPATLAATLFQEIEKYLPKVAQPSDATAQPITDEQIKEAIADTNIPMTGYFATSDMADLVEDITASILRLLANTAQGKPDHIVDANKMVSDSDPNAEWLTTAHIICTEQLIPCGHINNRLNALRDALAAKKG